MNSAAPEIMPGQNTAISRSLLFLLLAALTIAVFAPALECDFVNYDDQQYVYANERVRAGLTPDNIRWAFTSTRAANWHPVTWLSLMTDAAIYGMNPAGFHLTNLLLHLSSALLLFHVLSRMTGANGRSFMVAVLFAIHPLHVESVAWISERKDVLSGFFGMATLWAYARYVRRPFPRLLLPVMFYYALGLMTKPMLVSLPIVLLGLDYWPFQRLSGRPNRFLHLCLEKIPLIIFAFLSCLTTVLAQGQANAIYSLAEKSIGLRLANAAIGYQTYLLKMFWPTRLACLYPMPEAWPAWQIIGAILTLVLITIFTIRFRKTGYLPVGWLWYFIMLLPVIGLVSVGQQAYADRYTYLPLIGPFIMLAWGVPALVSACSLAQLCPFRIRKGFLVVMGVLAVTLLALVSNHQVGYWRDGETLFSRALAVTPQNPVAHNNLAHNLLLRDQAEAATGHLRNAIKLRPSYALAHYNLGLAMTSMGDHEQAAESFSTAARLDTRLGSNLVAAGLSTLATKIYLRGQTNEALVLLQEALRLNPSLANAHYNTALFLLDCARESEARTYFAKSKQLDSSLDIKSPLADYHIRRGFFGKAIAELGQATVTDLPTPRQRQLLLKLCAQPGLPADERSAIVVLAERWSTPKPDSDPMAMITLAAAYANAGRFPDAIRVTQGLIVLARQTHQDTATLASLREQLNRYEHNQPFILPSKPCP